jgi:hypothetical protein
MQLFGESGSVQSIVGYYDLVDVILNLLVWASDALVHCARMQLQPVNSDVNLICVE